MSTAIIGLGNIGATVARNLTAGGQRVALADHSLDKAQQFASELGPNATACSTEQAIEGADVVILAIYFDAIKQLIAAKPAAWANKIVVDPSNPIAPDGKGGFKKTLPEDQSSGQVLSGLLPPGARLVKAFGTLLAASLKSGARRTPERAVLFYATDDSEAGDAVAQLIRASGFEPLAIGGVASSIRIEVGGDLHEAGKLAKLVSLAEAKALV